MLIASMRLQGASTRAIAGVLSRPPSTVSRELRRNSCAEVGYTSDGAMALHAARRDTATLAGGTGSISTTLPSPGVQTITIVYSGDANNGPSTVTVSLTVRMSPEQLLPILQLLLED